jgi:hypothetical protein
LITEMKDIKHYFNEGVPARKGIEFWKSYVMISPMKDFKAFVHFAKQF